MRTMYTIHKIGTPKFAWKNHWTYYESTYWNIKNGWSYKWEADVFDNDLKNHFTLPDEGEWVEIIVGDEIGEEV